MRSLLLVTHRRRRFRLAARGALPLMLLAALAANPLPVRANRQVHLDVIRYCRDTFRRGKLVNEPKFVRDGRHNDRDG